MRMYQAKTVPSIEAGWRLLARPMSDDGHRFDLWVIVCHPHGEGRNWVMCRVVAHGRVPYKASYWFSASRHGKFGYQNDLKVMKKNRPKLHASVTLIVQDAWE